jgi:hypothetical protein
MTHYIHTGILGATPDRRDPRYPRSDEPRAGLKVEGAACLGEPAADGVRRPHPYNVAPVLRERATDAPLVSQSN